MFSPGFAALLFVLSLPAGQQPAHPAPQAPPLQAPSNAQKFQIAGIVVDALSGQPLAAAQVFIQGQPLGDSRLAMTTGEDGRFAFDNVAPGHYTLSGRCKGYLQQSYKQHEFFFTAIIVGPGLDISNLRFALTPEASISGQIWDEENDPVRHAQVMLLRRGLRLGRNSTWRVGGKSTDDQGHYRFSHLSPGSYFIAVSAQPWYAHHERIRVVPTLWDSGEALPTEEIIQPDPALDVVYPLTFFPSATDISSAVPITLHAADMQVADVTLRPVSALRLTVSYVPSGKPDEPENVWPQVSQQLFDGAQEGLSGVNSAIVRPGLLEITGLPPGPLSFSLHSSRGDQSTSRSLPLNLGADASVDISEGALFASISGVVKMDDGTPFSGHVAFHNRTTDQGFAANVEEGGEFRLPSGLAPGTYDISVNGPTPQAVRMLSATGGKVSGRSLEIAAGQAVRMTVVATKGTGRVTGLALKENRPTDGIMVVLVPEDPDHNVDLFRRDQSDSDGSFNLAGILSGKYTLIALENGWELDWSTPTVLEKYLAGGQPVEVTPNARLEIKVPVQHATRR